MSICLLLKWCYLPQPSPSWLSMKQVTVGGGISISTTCLLATFPNLYELPGDPLKKYMHKDHRKMQKKLLLAGGPRRPSIVKSSGINTIVKTALVPFYYIVCRPQQNPMSQIRKWFNALHATLFPGAQAPTIDLDQVLDFHEAAA